MGNILVSPTLTSQVRDLVYQQGLATSEAATAKVTVTAARPARAAGVSYVNGSAAAFIFISFSAATAVTTSYLYVGTSAMAEVKHAAVGATVSLAAIINPNEIYYLSSTASSVSVLSWSEYTF